MVRLYRTASQPHHWVAYSPATGWVMFPARENGWSERFRASGLDPAQLQEAPLWMAFHTGLIEAYAARRQAAA